MINACIYCSLLSCRKLLQELRKKRAEYDEMMEKLQREVSPCLHVYVCTLEQVLDELPECFVLLCIIYRIST